MRRMDTEVVIASEAVMDMLQSDGLTEQSVKQ